MITDYQRELRRKNLGGSDLAAVVEFAKGLAPGSLSPYKTAADVFWDKRPDLVVDPKSLPEEKPTAAQRRGNTIESYITEFAREALAPLTLTASQRRVSKGRDKGIIAVNLDWLVNETQEPGEAKSCADFRLRDQWGAAETDEVPFGYMVQVQSAIYVTGAKQGHLFALLGWDPGMIPVRYLISRDDPVIEAIVDAAIWFWNDHVLPGIPPKGGEVPPEHLLKAIRTTKDKQVALDAKAAALAKAWKIHSAMANDHKRGADALKQELLWMMKDADIATFPDGSGFSMKETAPKTIDQEKLKLDFPDVWKAVRVESPRRTPRYIKSKSEPDDQEGE